MPRGDVRIHVHGADVTATQREGALWLSIPVPNLGMSVMAFLRDPAAARALARDLLAVAEAMEAAPESP